MLHIIANIAQRLHMGGYAAFVWPAYSLVIFFLSTQWLCAWQRWHRYYTNDYIKQARKNNHERIA